MSAVRAVCVLAVVVAALAVAPTGAMAAGTASVNFGANVTVGQEGLPGTLTLTSDAVSPSVVENIRVTPSCGTATTGDCPSTSYDPGVFAPSATATGRAGTSCAGLTFTVAIVDSASDEVAFTPSGSVQVSPGQPCSIDFTFGVLRTPSIDSHPGVPGMQTAPKTRHTQTIVGGSPDLVSGSGQTTVAAAQPSITTTASSNITLGAGSLSDTATVSGRVNPQASATVTFRLYGPNDATCSSAPIFESTVAQSDSTGSVSSAPFTPGQAGTYRWIAAYSGDANNAPVTGACNDANENVVVAQAAPSIATNASAGITLGGPGTLTDVATVSNRVNPQASATVTFRLYGPNDATCSSAPIFTPSPAPYPVAGGSVTSPAFTPSQAGTYRWIAAYSGDANNAPVTGACNDANESTVVAKAAPSIATNASAGIFRGGSVTDTATVSGRVNPQSGAFVDFRLFGPSDPTCSAAPVFVSFNVPYPVAGGPVTSEAYTPTAAGTYRWIASYSGDPNNLAATGVCGDPDEAVVVTEPAAPGAPTVTSGPDGDQSSSSASFTFSGDQGATFECKLDAGAFVACGSPQTYTGLAVARHTFSVRQISAQGATGPATERTFTVVAAPIGLPPPPPPAAEPPRSVALVVGRRTLVSGGRVPVGCRADRPSIRRCVATLRIDGRTVGTGSSTVTVPGTRSTTVRIKLSAAGLRAIRRSKRGRTARISIAAETFGTPGVLTQEGQTVVVSPRLFVVDGDLLFATGSTRLRPLARRHLRLLSVDVGVVRTITCTGHTDSVGPAADNRRLGLGRARVVCRFLAASRRGASTRSISRGEADPRASNRTARGRALNRRVAITVTR